MDSAEIYRSLTSRNGGDLYIGVVGPVRTGKSTFIAKFMENMVLPKLVNASEKTRTIDEMPQSADGKVVMTTQPKFVPEKACNVELSKGICANIRLVDCVGYMVDGASVGEDENGKERMVKTPWSDEMVPFSKAAEIGTDKVIMDHSNIGVVITTDGSFSEIARPNYAFAEEVCVQKLKEINKPFVIVVNSKNPKAEETKKLVASLKTKYDKPVLALDVSSLNEEGISKIFEEVLKEYPFEKIKFHMPAWLNILPQENEYIAEVIEEGRRLATSLKKIGDMDDVKLFAESENFAEITHGKVDLDKAEITYDILPKPELFYKVLSSEAGIEINNEFDLVYNLKELSSAKKSYDKIKDAMESLEANGYGIVAPTPDQMTLAEPEIVKQGSRYGVRLKATAPSLHIMKVDIETEVNPILGTEAQSEELLKNMMTQFENNPSQLWQTNIFGRSLFDLVNDGLKSKVYSMPDGAQQKMRKTLGRIVNEGKGGVICILL